VPIGRQESLGKRQVDAVVRHQQPAGQTLFRFVTVDAHCFVVSGFP
jgi:hypothetical protein